MVEVCYRTGGVVVAMTQWWFHRSVYRLQCSVHCICDKHIRTHTLVHTRTPTPTYTGSYNICIIPFSCHQLAPIFTCTHSADHLQLAPVVFWGRQRHRHIVFSSVGFWILRVGIYIICVI